jgi:3'(2'), 5'-bisphosphate nucleotidase
MDLSALLELAKITAIAAGSAIMPFYSPTGGTPFSKKADSSPVTAADLAANTVISDKLSTTPFPLLSEEGVIPILVK